MPEILPWHERYWQQIIGRFRAGRLPHALLLTGQSGLGKSLFAHQLADAFLCRSSQPNGQACGQCDSCLLLQAGTHPDYFYLTIPEGKTRISIDQVRLLIEKLGLMSQQSGYRVAIIEPADMMTIEAMNSLLKILEEPGENTSIILVSSNEGSLPATIRSRCQRLAFVPPATNEGLAWLRQQGLEAPDLLLALSNGAPLAALEGDSSTLLETRSRFMDAFRELLKGQSDPLKVASEWSKEHAAAVIGWLNSWVMDMIRLKMAGDGITIQNKDMYKYLNPMAERLDLGLLYEQLDQLKQAQRQLRSNVSQQVILEDLMMFWAEALRKSAAISRQA